MDLSFPLSIITQNYISIVLAAVASMIVGFLWYSPVMFAKPWMKLSGIDPKKMKSMSNAQMTRTYGLSTLAAFVMAFVLDMGLNIFGVGVVNEALFMLVFWIWLGFIATTMITSVLYDNRPWKLFLINTGYQLASLLVMAVVLVLV